MRILRELRCSTKTVSFLQTSSDYIDWKSRNVTVTSALQNFCTVFARKKQMELEQGWANISCGGPHRKLYCYRDRIYYIYNCFKNFNKIFCNS